MIICCFFQIQAHQDPFLRSMAHWVLEDYSGALDTLLEQPATGFSSGCTESKCDAGWSAVLITLVSSFLYLLCKGQI